MGSFGFVASSFGWFLVAFKWFRGVFSWLRVVSDGFSWFSLSVVTGLNFRENLDLRENIPELRQDILHYHANNAILGNKSILKTGNKDSQT